MIVNLGCLSHIHSVSSKSWSLVDDTFKKAFYHSVKPSTSKSKSFDKAVIISALPFYFGSEAVLH